MTPNRKERHIAGRALRETCARQSHGKWKPPTRRSDPVKLLIESSKGRVQQLLPIRYWRMMQSPLAFYRGTAAIMAADLAPTPISGIRVQACGDCHLLNFGAFATPERNLVFDINDFDETLPAPWEWDIKRLAVSFAVAGEHNGYTKGDTRDVVAQCVESYREHLHEFAERTTLQCWYEQIHVDHLLNTIPVKKRRDEMRAQVNKAARRAELAGDYPKLVSAENGEPRIKDNPPLIFHHKSFEMEENGRAIQTAFRKYRATLSEDRRHLLDRYEIKDIAAKVVGVGSVGTRCGILLLMAGAEDVLFLQVKEARRSVLESYAGPSRHDNQGERIVVGQRLTQTASDIFLGWTEDQGRYFYVRQLRDIKIKPVIEDINATRLGEYAKWCGWALARAHAKSGDAAMISGYLGSSPRFDDAIAKFALSYAEQNERDFKALLRAIRAGRIKASQE